MMQKFVIEGGQALAGEFVPSGSKNEALPALAAALLADGITILENVPRIHDVFVMIQLLEHLGAKVDWSDPHTLEIDAAKINRTDLLNDLSRSLRASILLAGPLLGRMQKVTLPPPGGDVIGRRRLDSHFLGFRALGADVEANQTFHLAAKQLSGADIFLDEPSVTGSENIIMAAVRARGTTFLHNAACEPHVQGLCRMLNQMGADIAGIGTNSLTIQGVDELHGTSHRIGSDYLEIGSLIGLAAVTHSELTIRDVRVEDLRMIRLVFQKLGIDAELEDRSLRLLAKQPLAVQADYFDQIPQVADGPWPMFPTDMMSVAITVATQVAGTILFFEKMFDGRMFFVDSLVAMGAKIILCDPHRVVVNGPAQLVGGTLESPDVRAGMALVVAALCARGTSTIYNIRQIDRGYERVEEKLEALGAKIRRLPV